MSKHLILCIAAAAVSLTTPVVAQDQTTVAFARGQSSITLTGRVRGDSERRYVVNARAGQTLTVDFRPTNRSTYFNILAPRSNGEAMFIGSSSGNRFAGPLTISGPYIIQVYLMRNAARRNEIAAYTLSIGVRGAAANVRPEGDALVPGTNYNATADIPCITVLDGGMGACKAGVIRRRGGDATVELKTPDGGQRRIYFVRGQAARSDGQGRLSVRRQGDLQIIRIGAVEVYRIPDAFVVGG